MDVFYAHDVNFLDRVYLGPREDFEKTPGSLVIIPIDEFPPMYQQQPMYNQPMFPEQMLLDQMLPNGDLMDGYMTGQSMASTAVEPAGSLIHDQGVATG